MLRFASIRASAAYVLSMAAIAVGMCSTLGAQDASKSKFDPAQLMGQWKYIDGKRLGEPASDENMAEPVNITDKEITLTGNGQSFTIEYTVNAETTPVQIDMKITGGPAPADSKAIGILQLVDGKLTLCYDPTGMTRPTKFESTETNGAHIFELARVPFDGKKLVGKWKYESGERGGEAIPAERLESIVSVTAEKFTVPAGPTEQFVMPYKIDAEKSPVAIDMSIESGPAPEGKAVGIVKLDGDKFVLCYDPTGAKRPTEFKTTAENGFFMFVLTKQADEAEKKEPAKDAAKEPAKEAAKQPAKTSETTPGKPKQK